VLVVDDNVTNRRIAQLHLARHDVDTVLVGDGPAALDRLAEEPFDLVLLDGMMPGMDGPATAREIRRREHAADRTAIPIVALTASVLPEDRRHMLEAGMDDHVAKPARPEDIRRIIARWLPASGSNRAITIPSLPELPSSRAPVAVSAPILDLATFARLSDLGDASFVDRIVRLFIADAAERVAQIDEGLETGDLPQLRSALHALEGICGNVGATALDVRAREIHDMVRRREDRGEDPLARPFGPTGLEPLLDATRARLTERLNLQRR
jgi:two-component system sensor histidine kinase BarA